MSDDDNEVPIDNESTRCCFCVDRTGKAPPGCFACAGSGHCTNTDFHVTCPWCGYVDEDTGDITLRDGDEEETECPRCERPFHLKATITYTYEARRPKPVKEPTP